MSIHAAIGGSRPAKFFLLAWGFFLVGVMLFVMKDSGLLPYNQFTVYAMPLGSAIEGILLSFGLADRINILRKEKEQSQAAALASSLENERIIREQNVMLEQKVVERTHALQESNHHLKQTQSQLVDAEKMASLGQLTAGIAHEINNPVNFITSNIPPLRRNLSEMLEVLSAYQELHGKLEIPELNDIRVRAEQLGLAESMGELDEIINSIEEGASRTADIVRGLRNFSRLDEDDLKSADINDGIRSTITVLGSQLNDQAQLELMLADMPNVECYAGKLNQVFMNMLNNAVQSIRSRPEGSGPGRIRISTQLVDDQVKITISDNGIGMESDVVSRIFEPFYTTKDVGEGTGLGLSIAHSIVEKHNGTIQVQSAPGKGASFIISIPIRQPVQHQKRA